jgi:hypothetical protein
LRSTLSYRITPELSAGLEYNPLADDVGIIANWLALPETEDGPALILGTSSDRIGTPRGRAYYATFSKDLEAWTSLPVAPYLGVSFGEFEDEFSEIAGLSVRWNDDWTSTHIWDGENLHHLVETWVDERYTVGLLLVELDGEYELGLTFSLGFDMPWER